MFYWRALSALLMLCGWKQQKTWIDPKTKSRSGGRLAARIRREPIRGGFAAASLPLRVLQSAHHYFEERVKKKRGIIERWRRAFLQPVHLYVEETKQQKR